MEKRLLRNELESSHKFLQEVLEDLELEINIYEEDISAMENAIKKLAKTNYLFAFFKL